MTDEQDAVEATQSMEPIVIDLGKTQRKRIKDLKRGRGKLMDKVGQVMDEVSAELGDGAHGKVLVPVVILYRRKTKKKRSKGAGFFGF